MSGHINNKTIYSVLTDQNGNVASVDPVSGALSTNANLGGSDSNNTTTSPLGSGSTYTGTWSQSDLPDVMVSCQTDNTGTLYFDFSVDGINATTFPVNGFSVANGIHEFHTALKGSRYFRVRLVNDTGAQTYLRLTTYFGAFSKTPNAPLNQSIGDDSDATVTKSVLTGQDGNGSYRTIRCDEEGDLVANIHDPNSAFGELVTAPLIAQEQLSFIYNINTDLVTSTTANGGTATSSSSQLLITTSTNAAGSSLITSKRLAKYRPGEGIMVRFTAAFSAGQANSDQRIGLFDSNDGFFVGYQDATFGITRRSNGSDNFTALSSANIDVLDGSGSSGFTLDPTKGNVFQIQFQWLGYGAITFGVETDDGRIRPFHRINYANTATSPSIRQPSLPLSAEVINSGNTTDLRMRSASMAVFIEGNKTLTGITRAVTSEAVTGVTTETVVLNLRNKATYQTKDNRIPVIPVAIEALLEGTSNKVGTIRVYKGGSIGGTPSWSDIATNQSPVETDVAGTHSGGQLVYASIAAHNASIKIDLKELNLQLAGGETLTVTSSSGTSHAPDVSVVWIEDH